MLLLYEIVGPNSKQFSPLSNRVVAVQSPRGQRRRVGDGVEDVLGLDVELLLSLAAAAGEEVLASAHVIGKKVLQGTQAKAFF